MNMAPVTVQSFTEALNDLQRSFEGLTLAFEGISH
jgi:hypothetical protein